MKILYDYQIFSFQDFGGISRYFYESCKWLNSYSDVEIKSGLLFSNNEYIKESSVFPSRPFLKNTKVPGKRKIFSLINQAVSVRAIKRDQFDILHPTYYDPYYLNLTIRKPIVLTCYDLIHEKFLKHDKVMLAKKKETLNRATKIIAISQSTKNDLINYYNIAEEKISVIYLASSLKKILDKPSQPSTTYFLYVGLRNEYKNFIQFVQAIAVLLRSRAELYLYCAGGGAFTKEEIRLFNECHVREKIVHRKGSDESLIDLYSNAVAFFYPSLYEGFGIPLLEAMGCGCPVISSNTSSLPEVAQDAALYFNPTERDSILSAAELILDNKTLRSSLIQKGYLQEKKFSWERTAAESYELYKSIL